METVKQLIRTQIIRAQGIRRAAAVAIGVTVALLGATVILCSDWQHLELVAAFLTGSGFTFLAVRFLAIQAARNLEAFNAPTETFLSTLFSPLCRTALRLVQDQQKRLEQEREQRVELDATLRLRNRELQGLMLALNTLDQPIFISDEQDRVVFCNQAAKRLLSEIAPSEQTKSQTRWTFELELLPELQTFVAEARSRQATSKEQTVELELGTPPQLYRVHAVNVSNEQGEYFGVVTFLTDIHKEQQEKAQQAEFVSSVSHEMKTPLASIKAFIEMLLDGDVTDEQEQQELFRFINSQVDRLTRMINELLNLTRIESGALKIERKNCSLNEILEKACEIIRPVAEEKGITFTTELSDLFIPVYADQELLGHAVINLLSNAVKYTESGGKVVLRSRIDENTAVIEVQDTGMGIPEDSLPHIFKRFYRVPENFQAAPGTGLGLALVHHIVTEVHNGSIKIETKVRQGTRFVIELPLGQTDQTKEQTYVCVGQND